MLRENNNLTQEQMGDILIRKIKCADATMIQKICAEDLGYPCDHKLVEKKITGLNW